MKNKTYINHPLAGVFLGLIIIVIFSACKTGFPLWPESHYRGLMQNYIPGSEHLYLAHEGSYVLKVYEHDTIFGRSKMKYYNTESMIHQLEGTPIDSLYLYFVDDYRFYYSRKQLTSLDLTDMPGRKKRIGIYMLYKDEDDRFNLLLNSADDKVKEKERRQFIFAEIFLKIQSKDTLQFVKAEYPRQMGPQTGLHPESNVRHLKADDMTFHAEWHFDPGEIELKYNDLPVRKIVYDKNTGNRLYHTESGEVITESLHIEQRKTY